MINKAYILNKETGKIELHFSKQEYQSLSEDLKKELKRHFLFSGKSKVWVSRSKNNHYYAIQIAKKLGFTEQEETGERLSYAEELERKAEKAEARAERYEQYADNAEHRAANLQTDFNKHRGDIAFMTQPIISGHSGSQAFKSYRDKIVRRYEKGFEEYRKSEYFKERAETARQTADMAKLTNKVYLDNRIKECNKNIKQLENNVIHYEDILFKKENDQETESFYQNKTAEQITEYLNKTLEKMEWEIDKLAFLENCLDELGGINYSKDNIKPGYLVKIRGGWDLVLKANPKSIDAKIVNGGAAGMVLRYPYSEIQDMKIPEDWQEQEKETKNPFVIGDLVVRYNAAGNCILRAYQVVKTTNKTVTIQQIKVESNTPVKDVFISDEQERKTAKQDRSGNYVLNDNEWYLYKFAA